MSALEIRDEWKMLFTDESEIIQQETDAMREGEWNRDPCDHIEERQRDIMLGEEE